MILKIKLLQPFLFDNFIPTDPVVLSEAVSMIELLFLIPYIYTLL